MGSKDEAKKSQLLSTDGWENYQKELTRLCFEFWEVNEKQVRLNNSIQSDLVLQREPVEIQLPTSLFADESNNDESDVIGIESKVFSDNTATSKELKNNVCAEIDGNLFKNKIGNNPVTRQNSGTMNSNFDWQTCENCSKIDDVKGNEWSKRKILKRFSFYKYSSKQAKPKNKKQSTSFDKYSSCTLKDWRKCKEWLDTVEKIKAHNLNVGILSENVEENIEKINFDKRSDTSVYNYSLDIEAKQMEQKVKKLVKSINEKNRLLFTDADVNEQTAAKFGPSNRFKFFFKNVFQGDHDELDLQQLDYYTKHINDKLNTWRTLLDCLDDVRQRMSCKTNLTATRGTSKDGYDGCSAETNRKNHDDRRRLLVTTDGSHDECGRSKFVETSEGLGGSPSRQKKYNFFKLLNKTKRSVDMQPARADRTGRRGVGGVRADNGHDYCSLHGVHGVREKTPPNRCDAAVVQHADGRKHPAAAAERIRKSFSDTDLPSMRPRRLGSLLESDETVRIGGETLTRSSISDRDERRAVYTNDCCSWEDAARDLWADRQECFQTVVARLEYVGSTFREPCRLAGLKVLCKVDVLASFGRPAEAVDLFVRSALPLSENPDLMIRKAEAAYDWKFFCHLSMWRHSFKE